MLFGADQDFSIPIEGTCFRGTYSYYDGSSWYDEANELTLTGTYVYDFEKGENFSEPEDRYYLENGTALWSNSRDGIQTDISFEVKNGQTINDGQFLIDSYQYTDGLKYYITNADQMWFPYIQLGDSVDDLLFHTFPYIW